MRVWLLFIGMVITLLVLRYLAFAPPVHEQVTSVGITRTSDTNPDNAGLNAAINIASLTHSPVGGAPADHAKIAPVSLEYTPGTVETTNDAATPTLEFVTETAPPSGNPIISDHLTEIISAADATTLEYVKPAHTQLYFRHNALPDPDNEVSHFPTEQRRIYVHFNYTNLPYDEVLVKWIQVLGNEGEVLILDKRPVDKNDSQHYIWSQPANGWDRGTYRVELFSPDDELTLLAAGNYTIDTPP